MTRAPWYLGPLGGLRELPVPNPGIEDTVTRYGGIHQGLSGARTVDVTGHRGAFTFTWNFLLPDEYNYLRALHTRLIPGPYRLIDPRFKNRLSTQSTAMSARANTGIAITRGLGLAFIGTINSRWEDDWPAEAGFGVRSLRFTGYQTGGEFLSVVRFDNGYHLPVFDKETVNFSVYAKTEASSSHCSLSLDFYDKSLNRLEGDFIETFELSDTWKRIHIATDVPPNCVAVAPNILLGRWDTPGDTAEPLLFAAPQFEAGLTPTAWEIGGGALTVSIESLTSSSPQYLYEDCTLTLVEA